MDSWLFKIILFQLTLCAINVYSEKSVRELLEKVYDKAESNHQPLIVVLDCSVLKQKEKDIQPRAIPEDDILSGDGNKPKPKKIDGKLITKLKKSVANYVQQETLTDSNSMEEETQMKDYYKVLPHHKLSQKPKKNHYKGLFKVPPNQKVSSNKARGNSRPTIYRQGDYSPDNILDSPVVKSLLRISNDLRCNARDECMDACKEKFSKKKKLKCKMQMSGYLQRITCVVATVYYSITEAKSIQAAPAWKGLEGFFRSCGVCMYSLDGVSIALPVENNMREPQYIGNFFMGFVVFVLPAAIETMVNLIEATGHLVKGCLGGGILGIHEAFMKCGLWTSVFVTIVFGFYISYCLHILVNSAQTLYQRLHIPEMSFPDVAEASLEHGPFPKLRKYSKWFSTVPAWKDAVGFFEFSGIVIFSMEGVGVTLPIENNMKDPKKFPIVIALGMTIVLSFLITVGFFGYWGFGEQSISPVTLNFPNDVFPMVLKCLMGFMIFITFALNFWAPFNLVWFYVSKKHDPKKHWIWERVYRATFVTVITAIAIAFPNIGNLMGLLGAFALSNMGFIFPAVIDLLVIWTDPGLGKWKWRLWKNCLIFVTGILLFFAGIKFRSEESSIKFKRPFHVKHFNLFDFGDAYILKYFQTILNLYLSGTIGVNFEQNIGDLKETID
ncbi:unnamed protein product [Leptidea sinapis]|uniref:Amino acid transporter transmembrane domain-containing protein n=1 Tax=Leptidea sinapis TaxID=189913 RepID=A0A5E4QG57_9NEOP|nr:unnamed protein product [Leptidea sinapis]